MDGAELLEEFAVGEVVGDRVGPAGHQVVGGGVEGAREALDGLGGGLGLVALVAADLDVGHRDALGELGLREAAVGAEALDPGADVCDLAKLMGAKCGCGADASLSRLLILLGASPAVAAGDDLPASSVWKSRRPGSSYTAVTLAPTRERIDVDDLVMTPDGVARAGAEDLLR